MGSKKGIRIFSFISFLCSYITGIIFLLSGFSSQFVVLFLIGICGSSLLIFLFSHLRGYREIKKDENSNFG